MWPLLLVACGTPVPKPSTDDTGCLSLTFYADTDGDGYGAAGTARTSCTPSDGWVTNASDCDDGDPAAYPTAPEDCTATKDLDCDGVVGAPDEDGDGFGACEDCDDGDVRVHPGAEERCDGVDEDCDGEIDDDPTDATGWYVDADGDGYGDPSEVVYACDAPADTPATADDCDDTDPAVNPGAAEVCNGIDDDCDHGVDGEGSTDATAWYADFDGDGYGESETARLDCAPYSWEADIGGDCDDEDPAVSPAAPETCDGTDEDCDGMVDEGAVDAGTWYTDDDGDGVGDPASPTAACTQPSGTVTNADDCDDGRPDVFPGANEQCNGRDDDCDGLTDEEGAIDAYLWYRDDDRDSWGGDPVLLCAPYAGVVARGGDCDDADPAIQPGAPERCDGVDQDCDGIADDDAIDAPAWYADADGDGYGDAAAPETACDAPAGTVSDATDCDDTDAAVSPVAAESCNGRDDDCDGIVDADATDTPVWYADTDGDGYGDPFVTAGGCEAPAGYVADARDCDDAAPDVHPGAEESCVATVDANCDGASGDADGDADGFRACVDCDDGDAAVFPGAAEVCDGLDDDCDGVADDGVSGTFYADLDADGWGDPDDAVEACTAPLGWTDRSGDCDDADPTVSPDAIEHCDTEADDDCDGEANEEGADGCTTWYPDADGDSWGGSAGACWCTASPDYPASAGDDCDDTDAAAHLGAPERWGNRQDDDCDGDVDVLLSDEADARPTDGTTHIWTTAAIDGAGDVDGDGHPDLLVSSGSASGSGRAWVLRGPLDAGASLTSAWHYLDGAVFGDHFGEAAAGVGDVDGDGRDDLVVAAPSASGNSGDVYLLLGPAAIATTSSADAEWVGFPGDLAGLSLDGAGDVDGDGRDDVLVGAPRNDAGGSTAGAAYLVTAPPSGVAQLSLVADATILGNRTSEEMGYAVAGLGDVDGDGFDDIAVGALDGYSPDGVTSGGAYVYHGPVSGTLSPSDADAAVFGTRSSDDLGARVAGGDVDGDGSIDLIVAAEDSTGGAVYVFASPLSPTDTTATATATLRTETYGDDFGSALAVLGDLDGDGRDTFAVGAPLNDHHLAGAGATYVFRGPLLGSVRLEDAILTVYGATSGSQLGGAVGGVGDLDGDGVPDLGVTAETGATVSLFWAR